MTPSTPLYGDRLCRLLPLFFADSSFSIEISTIMLRCIFTSRTTVNRHRRQLSNCFARRFFNANPSDPNSKSSTDYVQEFSSSKDALPPPPLALHRLRPRALSALSGNSRFALSATVVSAAAVLAASYVIIFDDSEIKEEQSKKKRLLDDLEHAIDRSKESLKRVVNTMKHTGVAASVLWKSLHSVLSSANHEVWSGFEVRVAALLADIVAANENRRAAIVGAGGGVVLDWLLESVALTGGGSYATQAESARALAYLIADPNVSEAVLGRPHAIPNLLRFIFFAQPHQSKKHFRESSNQGEVHSSFQILQKAEACLLQQSWTSSLPTVTTWTTSNSNPCYQNLQP